MLKKITLSALLALTSFYCCAESLFISGSIEARKSQVFSVPTANSWQLQIKWLAEEGTKVAAGDTVIMYETASLSGEVEQQEAELRKAKSEAKRSELTLELALKEVEFRTDKAKLELEKANLDASIPEAQLSKLEYSQKQLTLEKAKNELIEAEKALSAKKQEILNETEKNRLIIEGAKGKLLRSQNMLASMSQVAQQGGTIQYVDHPWTGEKIRSGDTVQRGFDVLRIPATEDLHAQGWLNEVDIVKVKQGDKVTMTIDAMPELALSGIITSVSSQAEPRTSWGDSAYFSLSIEFENPTNAALIPGMSVMAKVSVN